MIELENVIYLVGVVLSLIIWSIDFIKDTTQYNQETDIVDYITIAIMGAFSWASVLLYVVGKIVEKVKNG